MKDQKPKAKEEKDTQHSIQQKEGKSFVKPRGAPDSFTPPTKQKALPNLLQSNIETSLGHDFSNVGIHTNSQKAVQMKARAFTQGENVHFAPGEFNPNSSEGQNLIGHEFTHVAQQRAGVVKPTKVLQKGEVINDNKGLESEADSFGKKAVKGETVSKYQSSGLGIRSSLRTVQAKSTVIQMVTSHYGEFKDEAYTTIKNGAGKEIGVDMYMKFEPGTNVDAKLIGLVQSVRSVEKGTPFAIGGDATIKDRMITPADAQAINSPVKNTDEGIQIDQAPTNRNPLYAVEGAPATDTMLSEGPTPASVSKMTAAEIAATGVTGQNYKGWGEHGYRYQSGKAWISKNAELHDAPMLGARTVNAEQLFETTALAIDGNQTGTYYGSVQWGWRTDAKGDFSIIPFALQSQGTPSSSFLKAAEIWNTKQSSLKETNLKLPVVDVQTITVATGLHAGSYDDILGIPPLANLPVGTRIRIINNADVLNDYVEVVDGPSIGMRGYVVSFNYRDERS